MTATAFRRMLLDAYLQNGNAARTILQIRSIAGMFHNGRYSGTTNPVYHNPPVLCICLITCGTFYPESRRNQLKLFGKTYFLY